MEVIPLGSKDFIRGESSAENVADGGFSPKSYNLNLTRIRGVLDFAPTMTDRGGATLTGNVVASCPDLSNSGNDAYFVDLGGAIYGLASNDSFSLLRTISGYTPVLGTTEISPFWISGASTSTSSVFVTTQTTIHMYGGTNLTADNGPEFWTNLSSGVRHPLEQVGDTLYVGDFNYIHAIGTTSTTEAYVTLPPNVNITSLRKHPDGEHLIAFCGLGQNASHTRNTQGRIYIINLVLKQWIREIDTAFQVEGSRTVGGVVYVTYGKNFGYFDGNGIQLLKRLANSATTYSHNIGNMEDVVVVRDGQHVRAFGDLGAGKVWWRCAKTNLDTDDDINNIIYRGDNKLLICYRDTSTNPFIKELDYDNTGSTGIFYSNRFPFSTESMIKKIEVLHKKAVGSYTLSDNDTEDTAIALSELITTAASDAKTVREVNYRTDIFQYRQGQGPGEIKLIRIFHEPV